MMKFFKGMVIAVSIAGTPALTIGAFLTPPHSDAGAFMLVSAFLLMYLGLVAARD